MGKKTGTTAAERKRKSRQNKLAKMTGEQLREYKAKENERRSNLHRKQMEKMTERGIYRLEDSIRKIEKKKESNTVPVVQPDIIKLPSSAYRRKQSYGKTMKCSLDSLPYSPRKMVAVVKGLAEKMGVAVDIDVEKYLHPRKCKEELHTMVKDFYHRSDIPYTTPGMCDIMTVWDADGTKHKLRKCYLPMYLREARAIFQQTHCDISLSIFCKLQPKNVLLIGGSPKDQCRCLIHKNLFLKLDAFGITYTTDFWKDILCDDSPNSDCWLSACDNCRNGCKLIIFNEEKYVTYKKWIEVLIPKN